MNRSAFTRWAGASRAATAVAGGVSRPVAAPKDRLGALVAKGLIAMAVAFTSVGTSIVTNRMIQAGTAPKNIGWGTGTTAAAVVDTTLQTEAAPTTAGGRTVGTESRATKTVANDTYQVGGTVTQTAVGPVAITESGLFDATTAGNMLLHGVFGAINTNQGDSIAFTFQLTQQSSIT